MKTVVTLNLIFFLLNLVHYQSDQNAPTVSESPFQIRCKTYPAAELLRASLTVKPVKIRLPFSPPASHPSEVGNVSSLSVDLERVPITSSHFLFQQIYTPYLYPIPIR